MCLCCCSQRSTSWCQFPNSPSVKYGTSRTNIKYKRSRYLDGSPRKLRKKYGHQPLTKIQYSKGLETKSIYILVINLKVYSDSLPLFDAFHPEVLF